MSMATEILRRAIEASDRVRDAHATSVAETAWRFAEQIGRPWSRLDVEPVGDPPPGATETDTRE